MTIAVDLALVVSDDGVLDLPEDDAVLATGRDVALQEVARRWALEPGTLWEDQQAGGDLYSLRGAGLTPTEVARLQARLESEARAVPGVAACTATVVLDAARQVLEARGVVETDDGATSDLVVPLTAANAATVAATTASE